MWRSISEFNLTQTQYKLFKFILKFTFYLKKNNDKFNAFLE